MLASTRVQRTSFSATVRTNAAGRVQARSPMVVRAASIAAEDVPTPEKRGLMNLLLAGAIGLPVSPLRGPCPHHRQDSRAALLLMYNSQFCVGGLPGRALCPLLRPRERRWWFRWPGGQGRPGQRRQGTGAAFS